MRFTLLLLLFSFVGSIHANEEWLQKSLDILEHSTKQDPAEFLKNKPTQDDINVASDIAQKAHELVLSEIKTRSQEKNPTPKNGILLFASFSLPESELKHLFAVASREQSVSVVFKGLKKGENLSKTFASIKNIARDLEPMPNIIIDPTLFTQYGISVAPTMLAFVGGDLKAEARGIVSTQWILGQIDIGRTGDLGKQGTTFPIDERDMIEEMQARMADQDPEAMQKKAIETYWSKYKFIDVTPARKDALFELDPSITVKENILTPDGKVIAKAGQKINPLDRLPFTKTIVVFNPLRQNELDYVVDLQEKTKSTGKGLILIATQIDRMQGWKHLRKVQSYFDYPVYLLNKQLQSRFNIRHTPTKVHSENGLFIIKETYIKAL